MNCPAADGGLDMGGQVLELAEDRLGAVERGGAGLGHDAGDRLAGEAHHAIGEDRPDGRGRHRAVAVLDQFELDGILHLSGEVLRRVDRAHAGDVARAARVEFGDPAMGDRGAEEGQVQRALRDQVLDVAAGSVEEAHVLLARHALAGSELLLHGGTPSSGSA